MLNIEDDIRTLSIWLNEEQLCEIDRPALARILWFVRSNIENYPKKDNWSCLTDSEAQWLYDNCRTPSNLIDMVENKLREKNERK